VACGELRDFVAQLLVGGDLPKELPEVWICELLDRVRPFRLPRDRPGSLRAEGVHLVDVLLRGKELPLLPGKDGRLFEAERRGELFCGARELLAKRLQIVGGHGEACTTKRRRGARATALADRTAAPSIWAKLRGDTPRFGSLHLMRLFGPFLAAAC